MFWSFEPVLALSRTGSTAGAKMNEHNRLDAVLPLLLKDYERFRILDKSLRKFCAHLIKTCWVVVRDSEYQELDQKIHDWRYRVVPESLVIPELKFYRLIRRALYGRYSRFFKTIPLTRNNRFNINGWQIQQLIKLAIAQRVETDFYLTLDSDVLCVRPVQYDDLILEARAITSSTEEDEHPDWYKDAERILGLHRSGLSHGVTPAILNKQALLELERYLGKTVNPILRVVSLLFPRSSVVSKILVSWRSLLIRNTPWTEYSLYNTFLEGTSLFGKYHVRRGCNAIYSRSGSVWVDEHWVSWSLEECLKDKSLFVVIQSNTGVPACMVWEKVCKLLET
jgi:hypothetical protein